MVPSVIMYSIRVPKGTVVAAAGHLTAVPTSVVEAHLMQHSQCQCALTVRGAKQPRSVC